MNISGLNADGYTSGEVTHYDFKNNIPDNRGYGYRVLVTLNEKCFFVIKYDKEFNVIPKSVEYFINMPIEKWISHNLAIRKYDATPDKPTRLSEFLIKYEKTVLDKTNKQGPSVSGIEEATRLFFQEFEETNNKNGILYHSYYVEKDITEDNVHMSRIACTTTKDYNVIVKSLIEDDKDDVFTVKFTKTSIEDLSKDWTMVESKLDESGVKLVEMLQINGTPIEKNEQEEKTDAEVASTPRQHFNSKIFAYSNIIPLYFIIGTKARIVLTIKDKDREIYAIWDFKGGEDHRITLSTKAFDSNSPVHSDDTTWDNFNVTEDDFIDTMNDTVKQLRLNFSIHCATWCRTMNAISMTRV